MTPLRFEELYQSEWSELETLAGLALGRTGDKSLRATVSGARLSALYRRACEHLALARARAYPAYLVDRLERVTSDAHQLIYHRREFRLTRIREIAVLDFPRVVRKLWPYVAVSTATFLLPTILIGLLVYARPELILSVVSAETADSFEQMDHPSAASIGRTRTASTSGTYISGGTGLALVVGVEHAVGQLDRLVRHFLVGHWPSRWAMQLSRALFLSSASHDPPGRLGDVGALQHLLLGLGVAPPSARRDSRSIGLSFHCFSGSWMRHQEAQLLLLVGDREPVLDQPDAGADQHALELGHGAEELLDLVVACRSPSRARRRRGCTSCGRTARSRRPPADAARSAGSTTASARGRSAPAAPRRGRRAGSAAG